MAEWTAANVKTYYPEFASVGDSTVNLYIAKADAELYEDSWGTRYFWAGMALTAHFLAMEGLGSSAGGGGAGAGSAGAVTGITVGGVSVQYDSAAASAAVALGYSPDLTRTRFGLEFIRLAKLQLFGVAVL